MTAPAKPKTQKLVVALDGSEAAASALPLARRVAEQLGAGLEVLHVADGPNRSIGPAPAGVAGLAEAPIRKQTGDPAAAIEAAAADPEVALVVLTTHGRAVETGRGLGRVAQATIASASRPILLVRPEAPLSLQAAEDGLRHLLVPLDGSPSTAAALRPVTDLAARLGAALDLLVVANLRQPRPEEKGSIAAPRYIDQPQHEWPQWANEVVSRLAVYCAECPANVPVRTFLATGDVVAEVIRFSGTHQVDAIVLVRRSGLVHGHGRVLRGVLQQAPCPILLVGSPAG